MNDREYNIIYQMINKLNENKTFAMAHKALRLHTATGILATSAVLAIITFSVPLLVRIFS